MPKRTRVLITALLALGLLGAGVPAAGARTLSDRLASMARFAAQSTAEVVRETVQAVHDVDEVSIPPQR